MFNNLLKLLLNTTIKIVAITYPCATLAESLSPVLPVNFPEVPNTIPSLPERSQPEPELPPQLPTPDQLFPSPLPTPENIEETPDVSITIIVEQFSFEGNTAFSNQQLAEVTQSFLNRPITLAELLQARSAITNLYISEGYITSGAFIPPRNCNRER